MPIKINSISTQPIDFADAATIFQDGCILDRYKKVISFSIYKYTPSKRLKINSATGIISNIDPLDNDGFVTGDGLLVGESIKLQSITGSTANNGTYPIVAATDKTLQVTGLAATETQEKMVLYVVSPPDAIDYYYNLIGNNEAESYFSKTDAGVLQKYTCKGLNAAPGTIVPLNIGTASMGWVTDVVNGIQSTSTITVNGTSGVGATYVQNFTITHYYSIAPFFLKEQMPLYQTKTPPPYFSGANLNNGIMTVNALQYIALFNMKYNASDVSPAYYGNIFNSDGISAWFNQNDTRTVPEFSVASIACADALSNPLTGIVFNEDVNVTVTLKSASGKFTAGPPGTKIIVKHIYCPLDPASYQNTQTTLLQNFMYDQAIQTIGGAAVNGLNYGTNYQVLKNVQAALVDANTATITFTISYNAFLKAIFTSKPALDRNYLLSIVCE